LSHNLPLLFNNLPLPANNLPLVTRKKRGTPTC
jgi:hypothetical protein